MSNLYDSDGTDLRDEFRQQYLTRQDEIERRKRKRATWVIGTIVGVLLLLLIVGSTACATYNSLNSRQVQVERQWADVETQLQRRADLIPNLVGTVKGYASHEEAIFREIADARSRLLGANSPDDKSAANSQLTGALGRLLAIAERYPDLRASDQFKTLQIQLEGTENRISVARQDYNEAVAQYNAARRRFPTVLMSDLLGFREAEEFKAEPAAREAPRVDFGK